MEKKTRKTETNKNERIPKKNKISNPEKTMVKKTVKNVYHR